MLSILASIYAKIADARNTLYDRGVFDVFDTRARTISIGNITAGGTGKTPLVAYVATLLAGRGEKVCILTRGYGRSSPNKRVLVSDREKLLSDPRSAGDEPFELAKKLLGKAIVVADADRVSAAEMARREFDVTAFVLDDGFQHRKVKRDVDIVCIDATDPFGGRKMLPAGRLREPMHNLSRADAIVIMRADLAGDVTELRDEIEALNPTASIFSSLSEVVQVDGLKELPAKPQKIGSNEIWAGVQAGLNIDPKALMRVGAFCALGNPNAFFDQLRQIGRETNFDLKITRAFKDHHRYTQRDIDDLETHAGNAGIDAFLTTAKDAVKLRDFNFQVPCFVVEIEVSLDRPREFEAML